MQFTVLGEDTDIEIGTKDEYARARESAAEPDVVQPAAVAQGDDAALVDLVLAHAVVRRDDEADPGGQAFGPGVEGSNGVRRCSARCGLLVL